MRYPAPNGNQMNQGMLMGSATPVIPKINKKTKTLQSHQTSNPKSLQPPQSQKYQPIGSNLLKETAKIEKHLEEEETKLKAKKQREQEEITNTKLQQLY